MHDMEEGVVKKKSSFGASVSKKKKKRPRLESSDSGSSDELYEPVRKKIVSRPKKVYNKGSVENSKEGEVESERKRSGLDVFEFDEYEKYDGKKMKKDYSVDKKKGSFNDGKKSKHEMVNDDDDDDDESHLPISLLREKYRKGSDEPIKLQGNKQKKLGLSPKSEDEDSIRKGSSRSEEVIKKRAVVRPSFYSESKYAQKRISVVKKQKSETKLRKSLLAKSSKARDYETDDTTTPPAKKITPSRNNEGNVKRGTGTEKQLLREKIRGMLVNAGWKIDYRKRRTRDYLDAVYISPTGNAYWSITKAYHVFQKQLKEEDNYTNPSGETSPFTPLPVEILSKLTRLTQKKIEREMEMKGSVEGADIDQCEEKLSFYMKKNRRTPKKDRGEKPSIGRSTLLVRSSNKGMNSKTNGPVPYTGKRTILSWLIDAGVVRKKEKVQYMRSRKTGVMLEGWITRDGIHCGCCSEIVTVSKFEIHAGSKERQPFSNIFLESGLSLMQCQTEAWNKQGESKRKGFHTVDTDGDDPDDDTCGLCGDGGDLICCDGCASTFHQNCLDMETLPPGDWHCPNCTCKFCGIGGGTIAEADGTTSSAHLTCNLCEKKYHESCRQDIDDLPADSDSATTFCGQTCRELFSNLQKLVGVKHELEGGFSWSLIHRMDPVKDMLHLDFCQKVECNSKVPVALSVMDECFLPIVDRRSGVNLMHNVVYNCGSNFTRLNYSGFYTAILESGDEIISAASIRIHGTQIAEMPFIGTRHIYRRQGMCRRLLSAIESVLCSLKVKKLIIPAITEHMHTWTEVFNFNPLEELHKQEMRSINMLVFPGTDMLQKLLMKPEIPKESIAANSDTKSIEEKENPPMLPKLAKKSEPDSSRGKGHDLVTCDDAGVQHVNGINDNIDAIDSSLQVPDVLSGDTIVINSSVDPPFEYKIQSSPNKETIPINSELVNKLADSTAELKCLSPTDACPVNPEAGKPVMGTPNKDNIQSAKAIENQNVVSLDTLNQTDDKSTLQLNFDLNHHSAVEMETKLCAAPEISSKQDACKVNEKVACGSPIPDAEVASDEAKIQSFAVEGGDNHEGEVACVKSTDEINGKCNPVSSPTLDEGTVKLNADLNHQSAADEMESQLPVTSECDFEANSASVDSNNQSSVLGDIDDTHELNVNISANDNAEEIIENQNSISDCNIHESDEITKGFHSNLHQHTSIKVESESSVASKVVSDEVFAPDDAKIVSIVEDDVTVATVELVQYSIGETPVRNSTTLSINEDVRPNGVSDESGVQMKSVSDNHRAKEIETEDDSSATRRESNIIHPSGEN